MKDTLQTLDNFINEQVKRIQEETGTKIPARLLRNYLIDEVIKSLLSLKIQPFQ